MYPANSLRLHVVLWAATTATLWSVSEARAQDPAAVYIGGAAVAAILPTFFFDSPQPDANRAFLKASGGHFDAIDSENQAFDFLVEYQPGVTWWRLKPLFGLAGNSDESVYVWVSAAHDLHVTERFIANVNIGPAIYFVGADGKALGSWGVLRSGFEVGYRFPGETRLTVSFHHMSHGELLADVNPGTEVIALNLSLPLGG